MDNDNTNKHFEEFSEAAQEKYLYIKIKEFKRTTNIALLNMDILNTTYLIYRNCTVNWYVYMCTVN